MRGKWIILGAIVSLITGDGFFFILGFLFSVMFDDEET